jgi:hypothetical protein
MVNRPTTPEFLERPGGLGALVDLYERAFWELGETIRPLSPREFEFPYNPTSPDPECVSIRGITEHVVSSGYSYGLYLRDALGRPAARPEVTLPTVERAITALGEVLAFTEASVSPDWHRPEAELNAFVIRSRWGQVFDLEQMLEHAVTHAERHRRQIVKLLRNARSTTAGR